MPESHPTPSEPYSPTKHKPISRRAALAALTGGLKILAPQQTHAESGPTPTPTEIPSPEVLDQIFKTTLERQTSLNQYLSQIQPTIAPLRQIVEQNTLFTNIAKTAGSKTRLAMFDMYYPIYKACEQYDVPWYYMMIMHMDESMGSTMRYPNGTYVGAAQRHPGFHSEDTVNIAVANKDYLDLLPQNYHQISAFERLPESTVIDPLKSLHAQLADARKSVINAKTSDYRELLFAAYKLRTDAQGNSDKPPTEDKIVNAMYKYCAAYRASKRINDFYRLQKLFTPK